MHRIRTIQNRLVRNPMLIPTPLPTPILNLILIRARIPTPPHLPLPLPLPLPHVSIVASALRVSSSDPLRLEASVTMEDGRPILLNDQTHTDSIINGLAFTWSMVLGKYEDGRSEGEDADGDDDESVNGGAEWLGLYDPLIVPSGLHSPVLSINPTGSLSHIFPSHACMLRFRLSVRNESSGMTGWGEVGIRVVSAPRGGTFTVTPSSGYTSSTVFHVTASGWVGNGQLTYRYFLRSPYSTAQQSSWLTFGSSVGSPADSGMIPFTGSPTDGYKVIIVLEVVDLSLASSSSSSSGGVAVSRVEREVIVELGASVSGVSRTAQTTLNNAIDLSLSALVAQGERMQVFAKVAEHSLAASQVFMPIPSTPLSSISLPPSGSYAPYPRCFLTPFNASSLLTPHSAWDPTFDSTQDASMTTSMAALTLRTNNLLLPYMMKAWNIGDGGMGMGMGSGSSESVREALSACMAVANNPAVASSPEATNQLLSLCQPIVAVVVSPASSSSSSSSSTPTCRSVGGGCFDVEQALLNASMTTNIAMLVSYVTATTLSTQTLTDPTPVALSLASQASTISSLLTSMHATLDRAADRLLLPATSNAITHPTQLIEMPDCQVHAMLARMDAPRATLSDSGATSTLTSPSSFNYSFFDGASITFHASLSSTSRSSLSVPLSLDRRAFYHVHNPLTYNISANINITLALTGAMQIREDQVGTSTMTLLSSAAPALASSSSSSMSMVAELSLPYDSAVCRAGCIPICMLWDGDEQRWSPYVTLSASTSTFNVTTRFPSLIHTSASGFVDCLLFTSPSDTPPSTLFTIAAFHAPNLSVPIIDTSPSHHDSSSGMSWDSSSSSGVDGGMGSVSSSSSGVDWDLGGWGELQGPPLPDEQLPDPTRQAWGINATMLVNLPPAPFLNDASMEALVRTELQSDLASSMQLSLDRVEVDWLKAASDAHGSSMILANYYILPSTSSSDVLVENAWRRMQAQIGVSWSTFGSGQVTAAYDSTPHATYIPFTLCADGRYHVNCTDGGGDATPSSTGMGDSSSGSNGNDTSSTGESVGGDGESSGLLSEENRPAFISIVSIGGTICLALASLFIYYACWIPYSRRRRAEEEVKWRLQQQHHDGSRSGSVNSNSSDGEHEGGRRLANDGMAAGSGDGEGDDATAAAAAHPRPRTPSRLMGQFGVASLEKGETASTAHTPEASIIAIHREQMEDTQTDGELYTYVEDGENGMSRSVASPSHVALAMNAGIGQSERGVAMGSTSASASSSSSLLRPHPRAVSSRYRRGRGRLNAAMLAEASGMVMQTNVYAHAHAHATAHASVNSNVHAGPPPPAPHSIAHGAASIMQQPQHESQHQHQYQSQYSYQAQSPEEEHELEGEQTYY